MNRAVLSRTLPLCASILGAAAILAVAGPLNPPTGPVAPTYKTLAEVEPRTAVNATNTPGDATSVFKITQPGSYYLTADAAGAAAKSTIVIAASNVSLDLCGFSVTGVAGSLTGILAGPATTNLSVSDGCVRALGGGGIDLSIANRVQVRGVRAINNTGIGIRLGADSVIEHCTAAGNTQAGFSCTQSAAITDCDASTNTGNGFVGTTGCDFRNCVARANAIGYVTTGGASYQSCTAQGNASAGFQMGFGAAASGCTAQDNGSDGILADIGSNLTACTSRANLASGFHVLAACTVTSCTAAGNKNDGILFGAVGGSAIGNHCSTNGLASTIPGGSGAGIHVLSTGVRLERNNATNNDRGIQIDASGNFVICNSAQNNNGAGPLNNYPITGTQTIGPIIAANGPINTLSAWANFEY
jgi:hypothetical protein